MAVMTRLANRSTFTNHLAERWSIYQKGLRPTRRITLYRVLSLYCRWKIMSLNVKYTGTELFIVLQS